MRQSHSRNSNTINHQRIKEVLIEIGLAVCEKVHSSLYEQSVEQRSAIFEEGEDDTIYQIDRDVEEIIVPFIEQYAEELEGIILIAEGISHAEDPLVFPKGYLRSAASIILIMDPIDGTRGIMYDKRAAFFLAGVAPNAGASACLQDIEVAVMTELPTSKSIYSDTLSAIKGRGADCFTYNLQTKTTRPKLYRPSSSPTIIGGFAQLSRFFPTGRQVLSAIEEQLIERIYPDPPSNKPIVFEDQYISSGGQLYEMLMGHDRFVADLRTTLYNKLVRQSKKIGMTCHPYDLCAHLIGTESGLIITNPNGKPLDAPLDTVTSVDWIGYANQQIRDEVAPHLQKLMQEFGLEVQDITFQQFFGKNRNVFHASSPGRLDVMGGIADYSGSLLLQMPIKNRTSVNIAPRNDGIIRIFSLSAYELGLPSELHFPISQLYDDAKSFISYAEARKRILEIEGGEWAVYIIGCFFLLMKKKGLKCEGADVWIDSSIPIGKGVSSSAALEVATMMAICKTYSLILDKLELPILAQKVENRIVGAACGLMDQLSSYLGEKDRLLPIRCQPAEVYESLTIPKGVKFIGIDSGIRHAVSGYSYTNVRIAAFMGYSIIAIAEGVSIKELKKAKAKGKWKHLPYGGYLANIPKRVFEEKYEHLLPPTLSGKVFYAAYKSIIDPITNVNKNENYHILSCTSHPVFENHRVAQFSRVLKRVNQQGYTEKDLVKLGQLMLDSHRSYSACGLGNDHTDELVEMAMHAGPSAGIYGAKITGGGSGGTVCILCYGDEGGENTLSLVQEYQAKHGIKIKVFQGSSNGGIIGI